VLWMAGAGLFAGGRFFVFYLFSFMCFECCFCCFVIFFWCCCFVCLFTCCSCLLFYFKFVSFSMCFSSKAAIYSTLSYNVMFYCVTFSGLSLNCL
jgi:hypothetical protein